MIRNWDANETGPLLELWLESTIHAHPFIAESYWHDSLAIVRDVYLPSAQTWVWEQDGVLKGFISVMESRFIGALFVAPDAARQGIGSALIGEVKKHYGWLTLEVYQKNVQAGICKNGAVNVLTKDIPTSRLGNGCAGNTAQAWLEKYTGPELTLTPFDPPPKP